MQKYQKTYEIKSYECDVSGRIRIRSLFNLLQDMADEHANKMGVGYHFCVANRLGWVGAAYEVQMIKQPVFENRVVIDTWPAAVTAVSGIRDFSMTSSDGEPMVRASSQWVVLDLERMRPVPVKKHMPAYELIEERALETNFKFNIILDRVDAERVFYVHEDELDINQHVNNAVYPSWVLDSVPVEYIMNKNISHIKVVFKASAKRGDQVRVQTQIDPCASSHHIANADTGQTYAEIEMTWVDRK